jgi:hypothetical protein
MLRSLGKGKGRRFACTWPLGSINAKNTNARAADTSATWVFGRALINLEKFLEKAVLWSVIKWFLLAEAKGLVAECIGAWGSVNYLI